MEEDAHFGSVIIWEQLFTTNSYINGRSLASKFNIAIEIFIVKS